MAFRLSATGAPATSEGTSRSSSGSMFGKMKDRAAGAAAAGMAAASTAATKAAKTAKYGVSVARDAAFGSTTRSPQSGYAPSYDDEDEELELQRALAASMKTAAKEEQSRGTEAPQKAPPALPGLDRLTEMGFDESLARIALQATNGDVEAALAQLCADRDDLDGVSDGSSVPTPTHGSAHQRRAALEAAEKRAAEARSNAGTMDDWRQDQRRQAAARSEATSETASGAVSAPPVGAERRPAAAKEAEDVMLQQALAASMGQPPTQAEDPQLVDLQLRQAMAEEELDLQMALSASMNSGEKADPSFCGAAVGEEQEQEEERARLTAAAQQHLNQERQEKEARQLEMPATRDAAQESGP